MSGPENTFIASVHKHLPPMNEFYRMKNHNQYNGGIADCWYSGKRDLWVEYKFLEVPKRRESIIDLRSGKKPAITALQVEWLSSRTKEGRNVMLIVGCKEGGVIDRSFELFKPLTAIEFRERIASRQDIARVIWTACQ